MNTIKSIKLAALAIAIAFGSLTAQAQDIKPYAGAGLTWYNLDAGFGSGSAAGGMVTIGADIHENFAVEARIGSSGTANVNVVGIATGNRLNWAVSYLGKGKLPVSDDLNVYALIGGTTMKTQVSASILGGALKKTKTGFSYGGGAEFKLGDRTHIGAEWVQYATDADANSPTFPGLDVWGLSATVRYEF